MKSRIGRLVVLVTLLAAASAALAQGVTMTWTVDGVPRTALVFAPQPAVGVAAHKLPLVFAFHGHGGTSQTAAVGMHLQTVWPEAIIVYPQGLKSPSRIDPNGNQYGWQMQRGQAGLHDRDLKFFDAMLAGLRQQFPIDDSRIYSTGFSNGAIFSYLLWAERGKVLAAVGVCNGLLAAGEHLTVPRPVVVIGGESDPLVPLASLQQGIEVDRQINGAAASGQPCGPMCTLYPSSTQTPVVTRIHPGGHFYPPWASPAIVEFFKLHRQL
ncbi:MAG TPA: esterase [Candidatus Angelobacter sp.]|nr:esterase [Candidatus Angelobacter sp.]